MFVREKTARGHRYLYLVESVREDGRVRQRIIRALGRKDALMASGELDRLIASLARHSERVMILSDMAAGRLEDLFRRAKAVLRTRPIYHSSDAAIRGHVFCSFLALLLQKELADRCRAADITIEWGDLLRDLDRLQQTTIEKDGKRITTRTAVTGQVGRVFQAVGVALPPNMQEHTA